MRKLIVLFIMVPLLISGCWDQKIYEQIGFVLQISAESSSKEGELLIAFTSPAIGTAEKNAVEILHTTAGIFRAGRENLRRMSSRTIEAGKVQQVLFSEELAKKGDVHNLFEIIERDPADPALAWIVIVEGSPSEMLEKASKFKDKPRPAIYINQLLEGNAKGSYVPETRAYDFDINYFAPGVDPMTPLIRLNPDNILIVGSALFAGDKMVGKIDHRQTALLLAMRNMMKRTVYKSTVPEGLEDPKGEKSHMAVMLQLRKRKVDIKIEDNKPTVNISLEFSGTLDEMRWNNTGNQSVQRKIEEHLGKQIKKECTEIVKYLKEIGSDPIGIGSIIRARHSNYWKSVNWEDAYKYAEINIDTKVEIIRYGVIQ